MTQRALRVLASGPATTVQDLGRPGHAHVGVPLAGAADRGAHRLAARLVGNLDSAAGLEVTFGGLRVQVDGEVFAIVTGAPCPVTVDGTAVGHGAAFVARDGQIVELGTPTVGLRSYLAVRGGLAVAPVLGSRSTDTLSGLGPPAVTAGDRLPVGDDSAEWPSATESFAITGQPGIDPVALTALLGPRDDAVVDPDALFEDHWVVASDSDRVGVRINRDGDGGGRPLTARPDADPSSVGIAHGSIQVPPGGQPVLFLADHPVTGGYPVVAVLTADSVDTAAQLVPGQRIRFVR